MATLQEICDVLDNCNCTLSDGDYKRFSVDLLKYIAQNAGGTGAQGQDCEIQFLCSLTEEIVLAKFCYNPDGTLNSSDTTYTLLDGSAWPGDPTTLRQCNTDYEFKYLPYCLNGAEVVRCEGFVNGASQGIIWTDLDGNVLAAPGGGDTLTYGGCEINAVQQAILDKLSEPCGGSPVNVNVCNQLDLTTVENTLSNILTSVQNIDTNTDGVEAQLTAILGALAGLDSDDDGTALAAIETAINNAITELQAIDANTDGLEALLTTVNNAIVNEGDQTQALLTSANATLTTISNKLNESCAGSPINVTVCNQLDLTAVENTLNSILTSVQNIDTNTDGVEAQLTAILGALGGLDSDDDATALAAIETAINNAITELQAIDANTDGLEALLTTVSNTIISEGDQTQALLTTANTSLTSIVNKLNETCGGSPINMSQCNFEVISETLVCADGSNAIRRVLRDDAGAEIESFIGLDGSILTPTSWKGGSCTDGVIPFDICDCITEANIVYDVSDVGGGDFQISRINPITGTSTALLTITASDLNAMGFDAANGFLYAINRDTAELFQIDVNSIAVTNLGVVTGLGTLPGTNFNFGGFDPATGGYYVSGVGLAVFRINISTTPGASFAEQASSFTVGAGAGDMAFDECGSLYVSADGVITRYDNFLQTGGNVVTTIPDNGSGFSGSFTYQNGILIGLYGDNFIWSYNIARSELSVSLAALATGGPSFDFASAPSDIRYVGAKRVFTMNVDTSLDTFVDYRPDGSVYTPSGNISFGQCPQCCNECGDTGGASSIQVDQTHNLVQGSNIDVPAGLKTVVIQNLTDTTTINGGFQLGNGRALNSISFSATELSEVRGLLPGYTLAGGTWEWIGLEPIAEE